MMAIKYDMVVSFRYIMRNSKGDVLENTLKGTPTNYLHGSDGIQPYLQRQLEGLVAGNQKKVCLLQSSGLSQDDFTFDVIIDEVRPALSEELILGYPVLLASEACREDCECHES